MSRRVVIIAGAILVVGLYLIFFARSKDDDTAIRELIAQMEADAESRNWQSFIKNFSKKYSDNDGNSYMMILGMVKNTFESVQEIDVVVEDIDVSVYGDEASASCSVYAFARKGQKVLYPFGQEDDPENPRISLQKEGGDWKIIEVQGVRRGGL